LDYFFSQRRYYRFWLFLFLNIGGVMEKTNLEVLTDEEALLTVPELAQALRVPPSWVYDKTRKNTIPHLKVGKYRRFKISEVLAYLEKQGRVK